MKDLIIIGARGSGKDFAWLVERINLFNPTWNLLGFLDDDVALQGKQVDGYNVLGTTESVVEYLDAWFICAVGAPEAKKSIIQRLSKNRIKYATLIDPSVAICKRTKIGEGVIICANTVVTADVEIGSHVIIHFGCTIGHDAILKDYVTLSPGVNVSGNVTIDECSEFGTGAKIIQGRTVGACSTVGAGAVVVTDLPPKCTAVGCPAKPIKFFE